MTRSAIVATVVTALATTPAHAGSVTSAERLIRICVNDHRAVANLAPLKPSPALGRAARLQARNMARWRFFDHTDLLGRGPAERVQLFDATGVFDGVGENIAAGYQSVRAACAGWMQSDGHRENILGNYTHVGGGYARGGRWGRYYVQVFASLAQNDLGEEGGEPSDEVNRVGG